MELIDDKKRLLRLAVVFKLDLEDFILSLRCNQSDEMARSDFIQGVALFLNHAMVSHPATEPLVVKLSTEVIYYAPAATSGSEPSVELVDSLSQSMATTHLPDDNDDAPSDSDTDVASNCGSTTPTHSSAVSTTGNSAHGDAHNVIADATRSPSSGSCPSVTSNKREREYSEDAKEGGCEDEGEKRGNGEEKEEDGEGKNDKGRRTMVAIIEAGGRKHRKMAHLHNCKIPCGESMRIDE